VSYPWLKEAQREFAKRLDSGRMAHAYLLAGAEGMGKRELAKQMAATLLCQQQGHRACGLCRSCQLFAGGAHPDFRLLTFEVNPRTDKLRSELVIDQVRELNASMQLTHSISPRKVALIYPAEAMNRSTANALLKTLEEPPGDSVLLLVTHDPTRLPATIRSRCQGIRVRLPDESGALEWLIQSQGVDAAMARIALQACAGSPVRAAQMLSQGNLDQFQAVETALTALWGDESRVGEVLDTWSVLDAADLWNWLSLIAARHLRRHMAAAGGEGRAGNIPALDSEKSRRARQISLLQSLADRNRRSLATTLRKDLLLRDWLIQWSRLAG